MQEEKKGEDECEGWKDSTMAMSICLILMLLIKY